MFRNILLPVLAAASLAGCATSYDYRAGNGGDYYHGQPRTEYRYYDAPGYGFYGSYGFGGYAASYYYDRYGRIVYANPYGYYGTPYGYGGRWYRPRPHHGGQGGHQDGDGNHAGDGDRNDRRPPWRNLGGMQPPGGRVGEEDGEGGQRVRRQDSPYSRPMTVPQQRGEPRSFAPPAPRMRSDSNEGSGSRMGRAIRGTKSSPPPSDE